MDVEIVAFSRRGGRPYNEDSYGQWNDGHHAACVVADGAGGHGGGEMQDVVFALQQRRTLLLPFLVEAFRLGDGLRGHGIAFRKNRVEFHGFSGVIAGGGGFR